MKIESRLKKRILSIVLCLTMLLTYLPLTAGAASGGLSDDIVILYTNDVHTYIDGPLSYDVIAAIKDELQEKYKYVLLVDAGDHIQGTAYGSMDKGESIIGLMNAADYDVATLGNHEFDYNMQGCMNAIDWAEFTYISSNFYHEVNGVRGENVLDSYVLFDCGDEKIAFVGITTPETFSKSTPAYFQDENGNFIYGISGGEDGAELQEDVQKAIDEAEDAGATQIIALGHLGVDPSSSPWTSEETIAAVTGLDAFIDGHSHTMMQSKKVEDKDGNPVILTQTGEYFNRIGMMVIDSETGDITTDFIECTGNEEDGYTLTSELYSGTELISDPTVKALKDSWLQEIENKLGQKIGHAAVTFDNYDGDGNRLVRSQETNSGDLAADALYYLFDDMDMDVDIAVMNGGGIRNAAVTGDISYKTCKDIHPFGNVACLQTVTGQQILDMLEWSSRYVGEAENGSFLHVSGVTYKINTSIPNTTQADEMDVWVSGPTEYRVHDVMVYNKETGKWDALDLNAEYNLAGYNYTLRDLGGGFAMLNGAVNVLDYVMEDYMVLANYIQGFENGIVEADNSPLLHKYSGLLIDYSDVNGSGRVEIVTDYEKATLLWVGGVNVTEDNADDVFGDGKVSYDATTRTLTLNGVDITNGYEYEKDRIAGVYADGDLNIELIGANNKVTAPDSARLSYGIEVRGDLTISGDTLVVNGGAVTAQDSDADSVGIFTSGQLSITGANVIANGGSAVVNGEGSAYNNGVYIKNGLVVDFDGSLTAISGKARGTEAYSSGLEAGNSEGYINVSVYDGYLNAVGGEAFGTAFAGSTGICISNGGLYLYESKSKAVLTAGTAEVSADEQEEHYAYSNGIYVYRGDIGVEAGNLVVSSNSYKGYYGDAYAIYVKSGEDEDDNGNSYTVGGYFYVECDKVTPGTYSPGLLGTTVTINSPNGKAIYAEEGIDISNKLTISDPENGEVGGIGGSTDPMNWIEPDYRTILEPDGAEAQNVIIKPLSYEVFLKGLDYDMVVPVPAGESINKTYCELYEIDDFSEILNTKKDGYIFGGWYIDEACTDGNEYNFDSLVTADVTIYPKWVPVTTGNDIVKDNSGLPTSPQTGGNSTIVLRFVLLFVSGGAVVALSAYDRKRRNKEN